MNKEKLKSVLGLLVILFLFVFLTYIVQTNLDKIEPYLGTSFLGMFLFVVIVALSIIIAPVSSVPLFPLASALWGWIIAALLGTLGWTIGAVVAFLLARRYGINLVKKVLPLDKIYKFEKKIPEKNLFFTVVFLRMVTPIDGVSYLFGLFNKMSLKSFTIATIIGLIPFSFAIAYVGSISIYYQAFVLLIALMIFIIGLIIAERKVKN